MLPSRSYLLRAMHEWIVDSGLTPHLLIDADDPDLEVPDSARGDGKVILNVSPSAVRDLLMDQELVTFVARFGGVSRAVSVPITAVEGIYARENGRGMMFPDEDALGGDDDGPDDDGSPPNIPKQPKLRVVK